MILVLEATNSFPPNVIVCRRLFAGIFASVANQPHNFLFVITLIVRTVKFGRDCRHVGEASIQFPKSRASSVQILKAQYFLAALLRQFWRSRTLLLHAHFGRDSWVLCGFYYGSRVLGRIAADCSCNIDI